MASLMGRSSRRSRVEAKTSTLPNSNWSFQASASSWGASISISIGLTPTLVSEAAKSMIASETKTKRVGIPIAGVVRAKKMPKTMKAMAKPRGTSSPRLSAGTTMYRVPSGNGSGSLKSTRLRTTVRSSLSTPSSLTSWTAWLSPVPSSITPTTVYQEPCSCTSRPSTKTLTSKEGSRPLCTALTAVQQHTSSSPCILDRSPCPAGISSQSAGCEAVLQTLPHARVNWARGYQGQETNLRRNGGPALRRAGARALDQAQPVAAHAAVHGYRFLLCSVDGRSQLLLRPGRRANRAEHRSAELGKTARRHRDRRLRPGERHARCRGEPEARRRTGIQDSDRLPLRDRLLLLPPRRDRRQPSHPDHAGPAQRPSEFGRARLQGQARDRGDRHLPRHNPERAQERRPSPRREHTGHQHGRDARVPAQDLPRLLGHNRALAPLGSLAGLEEKQTDVGYVARQHATPFDPRFSARVQLSRSQALADLLKCYIDKAHRQAEGRSRHCAPSSGSPSGARTSGRRWWPGLPPS